MQGSSPAQSGPPPTIIDTQLRSAASRDGAHFDPFLDSTVRSSSGSGGGGGAASGGGSVGGTVADQRERLEAVLDAMHSSGEQLANKYIVHDYIFRRAGGQGIVQVLPLISVCSPFWSCGCSWRGRPSAAC